MIFLRVLLATLAVALICCSDDAPVAKFIVVDQKMTLADWPDSNYIASLDSILALEPIKKQKEVDANITMNSYQAPLFKLPGVVSQKSTPKTSKASTKKSNSLVSSTASNAAEEFADKFSTALSKLQSDPSNPSLYKTVEAKDGEDIQKLLRRTSGAGVKNLPRFYVLSALQSVNAGVALEHLNAGDKVRVPKI
mgnify:CR=1 FL=1